MGGHLPQVWHHLDPGDGKEIVYILFLTTIFVLKAVAERKKKKGFWPEVYIHD